MRHDIKNIRNEFEALCETLTSTDFMGFLERVGGDYMEFYKWKDRYWAEYNKGNMDNVTFGAGCTRLVVFTTESNYVFKIQYDTTDEVDFCRNERFVYTKAIERGCDEFFAWIDCIGRYGSVLVYAMEKVEVNEDRNSDDSYTYHAKRWHEDHEGEDEDEMYIDDYDDHDGMIEYAIAHNGPRMEIAEQLIYDLGVNDLHSANWGYRGDVLVAVDYGGYGEDAVCIAKMERGEKI
jgi:hypothetical protein